MRWVHGLLATSSSSEGALKFPLLLLSMYLREVRDGESVEAFWKKSKKGRARLPQVRHFRPSLENGKLTRRRCSEGGKEETGEGNVRVRPSAQFASR